MKPHLIGSMLLAVAVIVPHAATAQNFDGLDEALTEEWVTGPTIRCMVPVEATLGAAPPVGMLREHPAPQFWTITTVEEFINVNGQAIEVMQRLEDGRIVFNTIEIGKAAPDNPMLRFLTPEERSAFMQAQEFMHGLGTTIVGGERLAAVNIDQTQMRMFTWDRQTDTVSNIVKIDCLP